MSGFLDKTGLSYLWEKVKTALSLKQDKLSAGTGIDILDDTVSAKVATLNDAGIVKIGSEQDVADDETALSTSRFSTAKTALETAIRGQTKVYYGTCTNTSNTGTVVLSNIYGSISALFSFPQAKGKILFVTFTNASKKRDTSYLKINNISYSIVGGESVGMWSAGDTAMFVAISSSQLVFIGSNTTAMDGNPFGTTKVHVPQTSRVELSGDGISFHSTNLNKEMVDNYRLTHITVNEFVFEGKAGTQVPVEFIGTGYNSSSSNGLFAVKAWCKIPRDKTTTTIQFYIYDIRPVKSSVVSSTPVIYTITDGVENLTLQNCQII